MVKVFQFWMRPRRDMCWQACRVKKGTFAGLPFFASHVCLVRTYPANNNNQNLRSAPEFRCSMDLYRTDHSKGYPGRFTIVHYIEPGQVWCAMAL